MTAQLALALILALASAVALKWGFYRQHEQASTLPPLSLAHPLRSLELMFSNIRWLVGFLIGILGWVFSVAALAFGPLSLVQAVSAGGLALLGLSLLQEVVQDPGVTFACFYRPASTCSNAAS